MTLRLAATCVVACLSLSACLPGETRDVDASHAAVAPTISPLPTRQTGEPNPVHSTDESEEANRPSTIPTARLDANALVRVVDLATLAVIWTRDRFVGIVDHPEHGPIGVESTDGLSWSIDPTHMEGLPRGTAGPYRLWRFGDGYLLHGTGGFDDDLIGADPFVATGSDLRRWTLHEVTGIDHLFYGDEPSPYGTGGVTVDGSVAGFVGYNLAFESGPSDVTVFALRPGERAQKLTNDLGVWSLAFTRDDVYALGRATVSEPAPFFRLDQYDWASISGPEVSGGLTPALRAIGPHLVLANRTEYWWSDDGGSTWRAPSGEGVPPEVVTEGFFDHHGAAGPAMPFVGSPDHMLVTSDGRTWDRVDLPDNTHSVRHLAVTPAGVLTLMRFAGDGGHRFSLTPIAGR